MGNRAYFDPSAQKYSIARDKLLVTEPDDEWVKKWTPRVMLLPLVLQEALTNVCERRSGREVTFRIERLIEKHSEDGRERGHEACNDKRQDDLQCCQPEPRKDDLKYLHRRQQCLAPLHWHNLHPRSQYYRM